jgi:hypothetical protein
MPAPFLVKNFTSGESFSIFLFRKQSKKNSETARKAKKKPLWGNCNLGSSELMTSSDVTTTPTEKSIFYKLLVKNRRGWKNLIVACQGPDSL